MKIRTLLIAIIALLMVPHISTLAQGGQGADATPLTPGTTKKPIYLGPVLGYNRALHSVQIASFNDPLCPSFSNGVDNGFYGGLSFEYLLGNVKDSKSSIIGRVLYNTLPSSFEQVGDEYPSLVRDGQEYNTILSKTKHSLTVSYSMLTVEACYKLNLFGSEFGVTVGPTFDFTLNSHIEQTYEIIKPNNVKFKIPEDADDRGIRYTDNNRKMIVRDEDIPDSQSYRLGIKAGVQYEFLMGRMYIVPAAYYNYGITKLTPEGDNWFVHAIQMGVDIRFSL